MNQVRRLFSLLRFVLGALALPVRSRQHEKKLSETDKMLCWQNDEGPVEDESKYTKAWRLRSAERDPTTETHFDSEVRRLQSVERNFNVR